MCFFLPMCPSCIRFMRLDCPLHRIYLWGIRPNCVFVAVRYHFDKPLTAKSLWQSSRLPRYSTGRYQTKERCRIGKGKCV